MRTGSSMSSFLPPANEVCEGYVFTRVCHSVHRGGSASVHAGIPPWSRPNPPGAEPPPEQCMLGDTANKRAVRILLECILVALAFRAV